MQQNVIRSQHRFRRRQIRIYEEIDGHVEVVDERVGMVRGGGGGVGTKNARAEDETREVGRGINDGRVLNVQPDSLIADGGY